VQEIKTTPRFSWATATSWALYDFANTSFAMVVLALVWPQVFKNIWAKGLDPQVESMAFKLNQAIPCLLIFFCAPLLGQLAEIGGQRLRVLRVTVIGGAVLTAMMGWVQPGDVWSASALYGAATVSYFAAGTFYDSMIVDCAPVERRHVLSGVAFALGFLAGIIILVALYFQVFAGSRLYLIFPAAGLWWLIFALPLLLRQDPRPAVATDPSVTFGTRFKAALHGVKTTAGEIWQDRRVRWFLLGYILYIDGVHAVKTSAAHFGAVLGFDQADLIKAFLVVQLIGIPAALVFGWLGSRFGAWRVMSFGLFIYVVITLGGSQIKPGDVTLLGCTFPSVWLIAIGVGCVQGGIQALSRSYFAEIIPAGREISYFGFYSMMGKFAAFIGPLLGLTAGVIFGQVGDPTSAERAGFASFALLFVLGLILLYQSKPKT
jgi:UMF1 family MFS transporter